VQVFLILGLEGKLLAAAFVSAAFAVNNRDLSG
jgi:hypothetical protein